MENFTKPFRPAEGSKEQTALNVESGKRSKEQNPDVNEGLWAQAEHAASNISGTSGVSKEGKRIQAQAMYDQMIENDKALKKWAGGETGPGSILGDTK